jgi:hypothetical protein
MGVFKQGMVAHRELVGEVRQNHEEQPVIFVFLRLNTRHVLLNIEIQRLKFDV